MRKKIALSLFVGSLLAAGAFAEIFLDNVPQSTRGLGTISGVSESEFTTATGDIAQVETDVASLSNDLVATDANVASISGDVAQVEINLASLSNSLATTDANLATVSGDVVQVESDLAVVSGDVVQVQTDLAVVSGNVFAAEADIAVVKTNTYTGAGTIGQVTGEVGVTSNLFYNGDGFFSVPAIGGVVATQVSATNDSATTSTIFIVILDMSNTIVSAGNYMITFSSSGDISDTAADAEYSIFTNGVEIVHTRRDMGFDGGSQTTMFRDALHTQLLLTGAVSNDLVDVRCRVDVGTLNVRRRSLILLKL